MADEVSRIVGGTPLVRLDALSGEIGAEVFVKYEAGNPGGSIKDRAARSMVDRAEERGDITPGKTLIVEPTSGNTGVALAMIGAARGYEVVLTMPESMSRERRMLLAAYGARLVLTPAAEGMAGSVAEAERIAREGIDPELWERLKKSSYGNRVRALNSFEHICISQAQSFFQGCDFLRFPEVYDSLTREDAQAMIARWVTPERTALSVVRPREEAVE